MRHHRRIMTALMGSATYIPRFPDDAPPPPGPAGLPWQFTYLRAELGLPNWQQVAVPAYTAVYHVDFLNGSDTNDGRSFGAPTKSVYQAFQSLNADDPAGISAVYIRARDHREYLSHTTSGHGAVTGDTIVNQTNITLNRTLATQVDIRTHPDDVAAGLMARWSGAGIPKDYSAGRGPEKPAMLGISGHYYRIIEIEFTDSAGMGVKAGHLDGADPANNIEFINVHVHHSHSDGLAIDRGSRNGLMQDILTHHNADLYGGTGGNSASGVKMPSNTNSVFRRVISFKNSDDGLDAIASPTVHFEGCRTWLNGYYWVDDTNTSGETSSSWTPFDRTYERDTPSGNGNGFKHGGPGTVTGIVRFCMAWDNKRIGFTNNNGAGIRVYNNISAGNGGAGYAQRNADWVANNISFNNGGLDIIDTASSAGQEDSWNSKNSWGNTGLARSTNNLNLSLSAADFVRVTPQVNTAGFLAPVQGGAADVDGFTTPTECQAQPGWESVILPELQPRIGALRNIVDVLGQVVNVQVTAGDTELVVTYSPVFTADDYMYDLNENNVWVSFGNTNLSNTITGLENGVGYLVRVRAMRSGTAGPASASVLGTPLPAAPGVSDTQDINILDEHNFSGTTPTNCTVQTDAASLPTGPDDTYPTQAYLITRSGTFPRARIKASTWLADYGQDYYTASFWVLKEAGNKVAGIRLENNGSDVGRVEVNLTTGAVTATTLSVISSVIDTDTSGAWWRIGVALTTIYPASGNMHISAIPGPYDGTNNGDTITVAGLQIEPGQSVTMYDVPYVAGAKAPPGGGSGLGSAPASEADLNTLYGYLVDPSTIPSGDWFHDGPYSQAPIADGMSLVGGGTADYTIASGASLATINSTLAGATTGQVVGLTAGGSWTISGTSTITIPQGVSLVGLNANCTITGGNVKGKGSMYNVRHLDGQEGSNPPNGVVRLEGPQGTPSIIRHNYIRPLQGGTSSTAQKSLKARAYNVIEYNHVADGPKYCLDGTAAHSAIIRYNKITGGNSAGLDPAWDAGAMKLVQSHDVVMFGNTFEDNHGNGIWFDNDGYNALIEANLVRSSLAKDDVSNDTRDGIFLELTEQSGGTPTVRYNIVENIKNYGVQIADSDGIVDFNLVRYCGRACLSFKVEDRSLPLNDWRSLNNFYYQDGAPNELNNRAARVFNGGNTSSIPSSGLVTTNDVHHLPTGTSATQWFQDKPTSADNTNVTSTTWDATYGNGTNTYLFDL